MAGLGIPKEIRDRVLNHISNSVGDKHYNRHDYAAEKLDALTRWDRALSVILGMRATAPVVVPLKRRPR